MAYHLARFGAKKVLVLDRTQVGAGTTSQSSGILRTHYSVIENVELALASTTGEFVQKMGEINTEIKKITNAPKDRFSGDRKTDAIDRLNKRKQEMSKRYMESIKAAETRMRASAA